MRIRTCWRDRVWYRVPYLEVPEDAFHDIGVIDESNDARGGAAVGSLADRHLFLQTAAQ